MVLQWVPSPDDSEENSTWEESEPARALLGFDADEEYVEGRRFVLLSSEEKSTLLVIGTRVRDERSCLVLGDVSNLEEDDTDARKILIPSTRKGPVFWLEPEERSNPVVTQSSRLPGRLAFAGGNNQFSSCATFNGDESCCRGYYAASVCIACSPWLTHCRILLARL